MSVSCATCLPKFVIAIDLFAFAQTLQSHALCVAAGLANLVHLQTDDLISAGDHEHLIVGRDEDLIDDLADVVALPCERFDPLAPARRMPVVVDRRALSERQRRDE